MAQIEKEPEDAKTEFLVGIVGPFSSAVIGVVSLGIAWALGWRIGSTPETPLRAMFVWLGYINLTLAAFNMIPGYPLDGGRILRSILWLFIARCRCGPRRRAATVGKVIALLLHCIRHFPFLRRRRFRRSVDRFHRMVSAASRHRQRQLRGSHGGLEGHPGERYHDRDCVTLDGNMNVEQFVEDYLLRSGKRCFVVQQNGEMRAW